ncbi:MAG: 16S rRNA (cytosine(1402)-N(4))-methyltransferase [Gemmatimonadetes bacterium]|nr:16S rRNA (cytosine(1402)-N(4))-methyltransferase [Gemmatimonadota bacterium]
MTDALHVPVLLAPILARAEGATRVVDGTLGHGGHAAAFLAAGAEVLGIDRDPDAIATARARLGDVRMHYVNAPYASPEAVAAVRAFRPDFLLLDLGVSSRQLDDESRGFTFRPGAPLDMRMGPDAPTAAEWLASVDEAELKQVLREYGDEPKAGRMAAEIVRRRETSALVTSDDLVNAIRASLGPRSGPGDFARIFQAVRIAVNEELTGLEGSPSPFSGGRRTGWDPCRDQLSFGRGPVGEGGVPVVERRLHLSTGTSPVHLRASAPWTLGAAEGSDCRRRGDPRQLTRPQCPAPLLPEQRCQRPIANACRLGDATSCWRGPSSSWPPPGRSSCAVAPRSRPTRRQPAHRSRPPA